jgi:hypothetical protein
VQRFTYVAKNALLVTLILVVCSDSEACFRRARCGIPGWATWVEWDGACDKSNGMVCWCCDPSHGWVLMSTTGCTSCDAMTSSSSTHPSKNCSVGIPPDRDCGSNCSGRKRYYAMICDQCTHRLRFAGPRECHNEFYPLYDLGAPCCPPTK